MAPTIAPAQSVDLLLNCSACHTIGAAANPGLASRYPVLNGQPAPYITRQLDAHRTGKRQNRQMILTAQALGDGGAPAMARMYAYAYLPELVFTGDPEAMGTALDLHENGARERGVPSCKSCHAVDDVGGIAMSSRNAPRLHGQTGPYIAQKLRAYASGARTTGPMGRMQAFAGQLSEAEIDALAAYYAAFQQEKPDE